MNKRQIELIKFCGYKIKGNTLIGEKDCIASIFFDDNTGLFNIKIKSHTFNPGDYDSIEMLGITINHMLGIIYELNHLGVKNSEN